MTPTVVALGPTVASIGITGATGRVGARVARRLAEAGQAVRLLVRDPGRAPTLTGASVARMSSYGDAASVRAALGGLQIVLMVSAAEAANRLDQHRTFVDAAADAGVEHLVYTSFAAAAADCTFTLGRDHWATEEHIRRSGIKLTALRDNFYADFMTALVVDGAIRGPAGDGQVAAVAVDDVADVAAAVLVESATHAGHTYTLTGPQSLTLHEVADAISEVEGRPVEYVPETVKEAYASRATYGAEQWQLDAWVSTYTAIASGEVAPVTNDVERLTGRPALSLRELLSSGRAAY